MITSKNYSIYVCVCILVYIVINANSCFAQLNPFQIYMRALDSINDEKLPKELQTLKYKTIDYSKYDKCGTPNPINEVKSKQVNNHNLPIHTEIKVIEVQSAEPKKPTITTTPN